MTDAKLTNETLREELHLKKLEVIKLKKKVEELEGERSHEYIQLKEEYKASEKFREEARKRCVRFEKLMYMMIDSIDVGSRDYDGL